MSSILCVGRTLNCGQLQDFNIIKNFIYAALRCVEWRKDTAAVVIVSEGAEDFLNITRVSKTVPNAYFEDDTPKTLNNSKAY